MSAPTFKITRRVALRDKAAARSRGLGDTVAKVARVSGIERAVKWLERATGKPCGCAERRALLNRLVPYA